MSLFLDAAISDFKGDSGLEDNADLFGLGKKFLDPSERFSPMVHALALMSQPASAAWKYLEADFPLTSLYLPFIPETVCRCPIRNLAPVGPVLGLLPSLQPSF